MPTFVASMSYLVTPRTQRAAVIDRVSERGGRQPIAADVVTRIDIGDVTFVPFTGLATVTLAASAGLENINPEKSARTARASRCGVGPKTQQYPFDTIISPEGG